MRRIKWLSFGLVLAMTSAAVPANPRDGSGHAYDILGDLPVMHRGRVKPLNSMAIEVVKLIYGRSTIELLGRDGKTTSTWEPVAALLDWSARPEFWDNQDFILVEYLPLKRLLLAASIREQVRSLAGKETPAVKRSLQTLTAQPELTEADLHTAARQAGESSTTGKSLNALAAKVGEDHKWLSPRVLENTQLQHEGHSLTFPQWVGEILDKKDRARSGGMGAAPKLTPIEEQAIEIGERFFQYRAIREHNSPAIKPLDLLVVPRPFNKSYGKYSTEVFEKGMEPNQSLSRLEANVANTLVEYLQGLQSKDWALPGEDPVFDQKFEAWLEGSSTWIPLGIILESDELELSRARLPFAQIVAFRKSYRDLEDAERAAPGNAPEASAVAVIAAARDLGTSLAAYPESAAMARESHLNRLAPLSKAPIAHGCGLVLLLLSLGI
ncbi:MAG TPA: ABC transporter permease, partial [Isosphaeraceae bacterium]|nr:ABC transporter permease [Isosphaeraceae bacterium]